MCTDGVGTADYSQGFFLYEAVPNIKYFCDRYGLALTATGAWHTSLLSPPSPLMHRPFAGNLRSHPPPRHSLFFCPVGLPNSPVLLTGGFDAFGNSLQDSWLSECVSSIGGVHCWCP